MADRTAVTWSPAAVAAADIGAPPTPVIVTDLVHSLADDPRSTAHRLLHGLDLGVDAIAEEYRLNWPRLPFTTGDTTRTWIHRRVQALHDRGVLRWVDRAAVMAALLWPAGPRWARDRDVISRFGVPSDALSRQLCRVHDVVTAEVISAQHRRPPVTEDGPPPDRLMVRGGRLLDPLMYRAHLIARKLHGPDAPVTTAALTAAVTAAGWTPDLLALLAGCGIGPVWVGMLPVAAPDPDPESHTLRVGSQTAYPVTTRTARVLGLAEAMTGGPRGGLTHRHVLLALLGESTVLSDRIARHLQPHAPVVDITAQVIDLVGVSPDDVRRARSRRAGPGDRPAVDGADIAPACWAHVMATSGRSRPDPTGDPHLDAITDRYHRLRTQSARTPALDDDRRPAPHSSLVATLTNALVGPDRDTRSAQTALRRLGSRRPAAWRADDTQRLRTYAHHYAALGEADRAWDQQRPSGIQPLARSLAASHVDQAAAALLIEARRFLPADAPPAHRRRPTALHALADVRDVLCRHGAVLFIDMDGDDVLTIAFDGGRWTSARAHVDVGAVAEAVVDRARGAPGSRALHQQFCDLANDLRLPPDLSGHIDLYLTGQALHLPVPAVVQHHYGQPVTTHLLGGYPLPPPAGIPGEDTLVVHPPPGKGPALPFAAIEADSVARITQARQELRDGHTSRPWIARTLSGPAHFGGPRFVHYAGHGELGMRADGIRRPVLVTLDDEPFATEELADLSPDIDTLFCAACDVAALPPGSPLTSSWAMGALRAGVGNLIAGAWPIDDALTAMLVTRVYRTWRPLTPAATKLLAAGRWLAALDRRGLDEHLTHLSGLGVAVHNHAVDELLAGMNDRSFGATQPESNAALSVYTA